MRTALRLCCGWWLSLLAPVAHTYAQEEPRPGNEGAVAPGDPFANREDKDDKDIVVTATRATLQSSIDAKRRSPAIGDGLVSGEIGTAPDDSIGNALERIPGVTADRFKGNPSEVSVRGLGPTLSLTTLSGREVSTAGPDRSVSFQQFPSALVSSVFVYKSQQADLLEGGVAGVLALETPKPLDQPRRVQLEVRGDYKPKDDDVIGHDGLGYRLGATYSDRFATPVGHVGVSIGFQRQDNSVPEDYYSTTAVFQPCNTSALGPTLVSGTTAQIAAAGANANCAQVAAPRPGVGETVGDTYYISSARTFRAQRTAESRDALMGVLQWEPSPTLLVTADGQYTKRRSFEDRNVLAVAEGLRGIQPLVVGDGTNGFSKGALISFRGNSYLEDQLESRQRNESYIGAGLALAWRPGRLTLEGEASYSGSHRTETQKATRMRSSRRVGYTQTYEEGRVLPELTFDDFDVTDPSLFNSTAGDAVYARRRFVTDRHDRIRAVHLDASYNFAGAVDTIKVGVRYADHRRTNDNAANADLNTLSNLPGQTAAERISAANQNCRAPFTTTSYMAGEGTNLERWATFDNDCLFRAFAGSDTALPYPTDTRDPSDIDVRERTVAAYAMANFHADLFGAPATGNAGLRYVETRVRSAGYRLPYLLSIDTGSNDYTIRSDPSGLITGNTAKGGYGYWLPSANLSVGLSPVAKLRLAAYRAIARSAIESLGAGITINASAGTGTSGILFNATTGNPRLKPLRSWNLDASLELYANSDTLLSIAGYYKLAKGAVIGAVAPVPTTISVVRGIDGGVPELADIVIYPQAPANDPRQRHVYGVEASVTHAFASLPSPLDGFGFTAAVNRAFSNFAYPDTSPLASFVEPSDLIGLSKLTASGSVYWEKWGVSLRALYRYRSDYFKPNSGTNRSVRGSGYLDLSAGYSLTRNINVKLQALNVTNTSDVFFKGGYDGITEVSLVGPQYFLGVDGHF